MDVVKVLPRRRVHEVVVDFRRYVKELVDMAALEFEFESSVHIRICVISDLGYTCVRDEGPVHWSRASFRRRDVPDKRTRLPQVLQPPRSQVAVATSLVWQQRILPTSLLGLTY